MTANDELRFSPTSGVPVGISRGRMRVILSIVTCLALLVVFRLCQLQLLQEGEFSTRVLRQKRMRETIPARAGDIVDRQGRLLATTVRTQSLYVNPEELAENPQQIERIAAAMQMDPAALRRRILERRTQQFLWLKRRASEEEAATVRDLKLHRESWGIREEYFRRYPQNETAAHVVGMRDIDGKGRGGIEESLDEVIRGEDGRQEMLRDARGRVVEILEAESRPPIPGQSVALTIDAGLQMNVERILDDLFEEWKPLSCCAIVLQPQTGEILAMGSRPTFNPTHPELAGENDWKNRTIADVYEPGSTLKPCVIAWALEQGVLQAEERIDCENGAYRMGRRVLHDHHPYGELSIVEILSKSSNIGMAKIGERLGNEGLFEGITAFGFGRPTGVSLPGELGGIVHPFEKWTGYSTGSIPMGQEISTTPLQMITAYGALANGGRLITPRLVRSIGKQELAPVETQIVRPEICRWVMEEALTEVVETGTGKKARLDGYRVFGKTGTAQKRDSETGGYSHSKHVTSFLCGAPAEDPQALVIVSVDEPSMGGGEHYGGTVAAPAATLILERTLKFLNVGPTMQASENGKPRK